MPDGFVRPLTAEQTRIPREVLDQVLGPSASPPLANQELLAALGATEILLFRGRRYRVPPVGFLDGLELGEAFERFNQIANADAGDGVELLTKLRDAFDHLISIMVRLAVPMDPPAERAKGGWFSRFRRKEAPSEPHPFSFASAREVADLAAFFWARRDGSTVQSPSRIARLPRQ